MNHAMTGFLAAKRQESKLDASPTGFQRPNAFAKHMRPSSEGREFNFEKHDCENGLTASKKLKTGRSVPNVEMLFASWSLGFNKFMVDDVLCDMINLEQQKAVFHGRFAQFLGLVEFWHRDFRSFEKRISNVCIGIDFDATVVDHEFLDQEAGKLLERLNDFSIKFSGPSFEDEKSKIQNLVRIVVELRGKLNGMWTQFKLIFNATSARLNGAEMRPKAKPEARVQNFHVRSTVGVRSDLFQGESIGQRPSIFFENVDQGVESQSKLFTWDDASTTTEGRSAALEQHPGSKAHGHTQSKYNQHQKLNIAHGQFQNTHVNDSTLTCPFQNFICDPTTDSSSDGKDHYFEGAETTPVRGVLDCNKCFECRIDIDVPLSPFQNFISDSTADIVPDSKDHYFEGSERTPMRGALDRNKCVECRIDIDVPLSAKSEYCGTVFYDAVSNEISCPKNGSFGLSSQNGTLNANNEFLWAKSGNCEGNLCNAVSGELLNPDCSMNSCIPNDVLFVKSDNFQVNVAPGGVGRERARGENRTRFQGRICYVCRGKGHFAKDCPNNAQRHEREMNEGYQGQGCVGRARYNNYQCGGHR